MPVTLPIVKRRALTKSELLASEGAYIGTDVVFLIPSQIAPLDFTAKPGDVIEDDDHDRYTALSVALQKFKQTWRCTCRNLAIAHGLEHKIDIQEPAISYDAAGAVVRQFPPDGGFTAYAQVRARVQLLSQEQAEERGLRGFLEAYAVIVEKQVRFTNNARIKWQDEKGTLRFLNIEKLRNPELITELPVIDGVIPP